METEVLFKETQRFRQWWLWLIMVFAFAITIYTIVQKGKLHNFSFQEYLNLTNIGAIIIPVLAAILLLSCRLETVITPENIRVRLFPFHLKFINFSAKTIGLAFVREYNPILDYGGWGLRLGLFGKGKAYNVSGNQGIQLVFKDGSKLLIGTQKPDEAGAALQKAGFLKAEMY